MSSERDGGYVGGIVSHAAYGDLPRCIASLSGQSRPPREILVVDTGVEPAQLVALERDHPDVRFELRTNRGWGAGVNRILALVEARHPDAEFALLLNPDVELDADFAEVLLRAMAECPTAALASGKLLRPGRAVLDSAGIRLPRHRRPRDRGSEEPDLGRYERRERVFGVSGAALLVRRSALGDLSLGGELVDEDFFAYQDDTDLCWRAHLLGWDVLYEPAARAVHGRRWRRDRRSQIEVSVRRHSFKNHYLQIIKNEQASDLVRNLPWLLAWEVLRLGFALVADRAVLPAYRDALREAPAAWAKRREIQRRRAARGLPRRSDSGHAIGAVL